MGWSRDLETKKHPIPDLFYSVTISVLSIAGKCRTNLWPAEPDWPLCRCRTDSVDYRSKCRSRTIFLGIYLSVYTFPTPVVSTVWTWGCIPFPPPEVETCLVYPLILYKVFKMPVSPVSEWIKTPMPGAVRYRNKGILSGTGLRRRRHWTIYRCAAMVLIVHSSVTGQDTCRNMRNLITDSRYSLQYSIFIHVAPVNISPISCKKSEPK